ncbi:MAG: hypothetical protein ACHQ1H_05785, partial [Nitrososphaerales archaeon]
NKRSDPFPWGQNMRIEARRMKLRCWELFGFSESPVRVREFIRSDRSTLVIRNFHNLARKARDLPKLVTRRRLAIKSKIRTSKTFVPTTVLRPKNRETATIITAQTMEIAIGKRLNRRTPFLLLSALHPSASAEGDVFYKMLKFQFVEKSA